MAIETESSFVIIKMFEHNVGQTRTKTKHWCIKCDREAYDNHDNRTIDIVNFDEWTLHIFFNFLCRIQTTSLPRENLLLTFSLSQSARIFRISKYQIFIWKETRLSLNLCGRVRMHSLIKHYNSCLMLEYIRILSVLCTFHFGLGSLIYIFYNNFVVVCVAFLSLSHRETLRQ